MLSTHLYQNPWTEKNLNIPDEEEVEIKAEIEKGKDMKLCLGLGDEINTKYMKTHYHDLIAFCAAKHENETRFVEEKEKRKKCNKIEDIKNGNIDKSLISSKTISDETREIIDFINNKRKTFGEVKENDYVGNDANYNCNKTHNHFLSLHRKFSFYYL